VDISVVHHYIDYAADHLSYGKERLVKPQLALVQAVNGLSKLSAAVLLLMGVEHVEQMKAPERREGIRALVVSGDQLVLSLHELMFMCATLQEAQSSGRAIMLVILNKFEVIIEQVRTRAKEHQREIKTTTV